MIAVRGNKNGKQRWSVSRDLEELARRQGQGRAADKDDKAAELKHPEDGKSSLTSSSVSVKLT